MENKQNSRLHTGKKLFRILLVGVLAWLYIMAGTSNGQTQKTIAVLNIDTKGLNLDPVAMGNLVRLELEKANVYNVLDKYDVAYIIEKEELDISNCFGKICILEAAKSLKVHKMLTGNVERFGDKIIISLRLIDVESALVEKSDVTEYQNIQDEIQIMTEISVKKILGLEINPNLVNLLVNYEDPIISARTNLKLNGPRTGIAFITGQRAERIEAPISKGGYDGYPFLSQFGYQYEIQYLSAGNFQALVEILGMVSGLEQQLFNPSLIFMNGFRWGQRGWEIAFGPSISMRKTAMGFFDEKDLMDGGVDEWYREWEWAGPGENPNEIVEAMDSRGEMVVGTGWVWAIGKTFKSGYLNIPVNAYVSPNKKGWYIGLSIGFNVSKTRRIR